MYYVQANFRRCGSFQEKRRKHLEIFFLGFPVRLFYFLSQRLSTGTQCNWNTIINPTGRSHSVWWYMDAKSEKQSQGADGRKGWSCPERTCLCCHSGCVSVTQRHPGACTHSKSVLFPAGPTGVSWGQNSYLKDSIQFQVSAKLWDEIWKEKENPHRFMSQWAQIINFCFGG